MKTNTTNYLALLLVSSFCASVHAQGTFVYDQQSSSEGNDGEGISGIQATQPTGQSFTPTLPSVGFVRFLLFDVNPNNGLGASVFVNLRSDSISGQVIGSTDPVFISDGSSGYVNFFFLTPVSVSPGVAYFFQPVVQSGDAWAIGGHNAFNYAGGTAFFFGQPSQSTDLWFREGIVIPEPSSALLVLSGLGVLLYAPLAKLLRK